MTAVEIHFSFAGAASDTTLQALTRVREVYGILALRLDADSGALCVEYDSTRLNAATVAHLLRQAGLAVFEPQAQAALPA
jgi:hypothetical protein